MKFTAPNVFSKSIVVLTGLSRSALIPFFPLYLKYLNLTLMQMGIVRFLQIWTLLMFTTLSFKTGKKLSNSTVKQISLSGSIFTTITLCICLLFLPPHEFTRNVTHCLNDAAPDIQDLYNLHFKKISHPMVQNIANETISDESDNRISLEKETQNGTIEDTIEQDIVKENQSEDVDKNKVPEMYHLNENKLIVNAKNNENPTDAQNGKNSIVRKTNPQRKPKLEENYILYSSGISKEKLMQKTNVNNEAIPIHSVKKENPGNFPQSRKITTTSLLDVFPQTSHNFPSFTQYNNPSNPTSYDNNPGNPTSRDKIYHTPDMLNSKMKMKFKTPFYPSNNQEENYQAFDRNPFSENKSPKSNFLLKKYRKWHKLENSEDDEVLSPTENIDIPSVWHVNFERQKSNNDANDLEELFRKKRYIDKFLFPRKVKRNVNNNKILVKNLKKDVPSFAQNTKTGGIGLLNTLNELFRWSETFVSVLVLAVLYEAFSSQIIPWVETLNPYNSDEFMYYDNLFCSQIFVSKSSLGLISYPLIAVFTTIFYCPYQIALHCFIAAVILVFAFLGTLLFMSTHYSETKYFRNRKLSKPASEKYFPESTIKRLLTSITSILVGACAASYVECILWKVETLEGFPYNYEYLYCGYFFLNTLAFVATSRYLQYRTNSATDFNIDSDSEEEEEIHFSFEWIMKNKEVIYVENQKTNIITVIGTFLLLLTLSVVPFLSRAWTFLPLALLKGMVDAFLEAMVPQGNWVKLLFGYSIGCLLGSTVASVFGMDVLFFSVSSIMLVCCLKWLSYSIYLRCCKGPYAHISLESHYGSHNSEPNQKTENEEEDWLEKALRKDQINQSKKLLQ